MPCSRAGAAGQKVRQEQPALSEATPAYARALLDAAAYPHPAGDLRLHETHISWVFLAGAYAYKLKKPVNLGFLDFSTVEKRRTVCADELRLNRRLCKGVYLDVVAINERSGRYTIEGPGVPVEPVLRMRRLPEDGMLPHLLASGAADAALMRRIARRLARFHAAAATGAGVDEFATPTAVGATWQDNFDHTAPFVGQVLTSEVQRRIVAFAEGFLERNQALLERRAAEGRIREGHGDLHAGNVCVYGRQLVLFDCIEFSTRLRCGDVAADVAFLAMDLDRHGHAELAAVFVDAYVRASGDADLPRLLDFYRCLRAYVRGMVLCLHSRQPDVPTEAAQRDITSAGGYFDLAGSYALAG